jgi:hypothetical protein
MVQLGAHDNNPIKLDRPLAEGFNVEATDAIYHL